MNLKILHILEYRHICTVSLQQVRITNMTQSLKGRVQGSHVGALKCDTDNREETWNSLIRPPTAAPLFATNN